MGREVRRVPADWVHPRREDNPDRYQPMHVRSFDQDAAAWKEGFLEWESGHFPQYCIDPESQAMEYWEYAGDPPERKYYMPQWSDEERTHYQMYECTSEGTPISPVIPDPESLARWLADNNASSFAGQTATYEQWLRVCNGGWAPSAVYTPATGMVSGVAGLE